MSREQDAVAVERVADALFRYWNPDYAPAIGGLSGLKGTTADKYRKQATAAITAYNAWLRERAGDVDVVEAAAENIRGHWASHTKNDHKFPKNPVIATWALDGALDVMIGKEQGDE